MADEKKAAGAAAREREARIALLAKEIFVAHAPAVAADVDWAFRAAERFDDLVQRRWKELAG